MKTIKSQMAGSRYIINTQLAETAEDTYAAKGEVRLMHKPDSPKNHKTIR